MKGEFPQTVNLRGESFQIGQSSQLVNWNTAVEPHLLRISIMQDCGCNFDFAYQYPLGDVTRLNQLPSAVFTAGRNWKNAHCLVDISST